MRLFVFAFIVAVAFWPGFIDPAMAPRWAVMGVGAPLLLLLKSEGMPHPMDGLGLFVLALMGMSVLWAPDTLTGIDEFIHFAILGAVFCLGASCDDLRPAWKGLAAGVSVAAVVGIAQAVGFTGIEQKVPFAGLYMNKNIFAEAGMVALVAMLCDGAWLWAVGPAVAIIIGNSRAVLGALIVTGCVALWHRSRNAAIALAVLVVVIAILQAGGGSTSGTVRLDFWQAAASNMAIFGHGLGSFSVDFPFADFAHNEIVQAFYELGVFAALPVGLAVYLLMEPAHETERLVLLCIICVGLLSFPFHMPLTGFAAALAAGNLACARNRARDQLDDGPIPHGAGFQGAGAQFDRSAGLMRFGFVRVSPGQASTRHRYPRSENS